MSGTASAAQHKRRRRRKHKRVDADDSRDASVAHIGLEISRVLFGGLASAPPTAPATPSPHPTLPNGARPQPQAERASDDLRLFFPSDDAASSSQSSSDRTSSTASDDSATSYRELFAHTTTVLAVDAADAVALGHGTARFSEGWFDPRTWPLPGSTPPADQTCGVWPNVFWRACTMDELRTHARFLALPPVDAVRIETPQSLRFVRQDAPLWNEAHRGLLSTGRIAAVLGFREPKAARHLSLSKRMVSHADAVEAFHHLKSPLHSAWAERGSSDVGAAHTANVASAVAFNASLCAQQEDVGSNPDVRGCGTSMTLRSHDDVEVAGAVHRGPFRNSSDVRIAWGSAQEASSILSLLEARPHARVVEVGLCVFDAGHPSNALLVPSAALPPIGASPDGLLYCPSAMDAPPTAPSSELLFASPHLLEVLEVKNVSPFVDASPGDASAATPHANGTASRKRKKKKKGSKGGGAHGDVARSDAASSNSAPSVHASLPKYARRDRGPHEHLPPQHVAQLQLEMLATGACAAVLVSTSATRGTNVFRIARDDDYIREMLRIISRFHVNFVLRNASPPENFFFDDKGYKQFLDHTLAISHRATVHEHISDPTRIARGAKFFWA